MPAYFCDHRDLYVKNLDHSAPTMLAPKVADFKKSITGLTTRLSGLQLFVSMTKYPNVYIPGTKKYVSAVSEFYCEAMVESHYIFVSEGLSEGM